MFGSTEGSCLASPTATAAASTVATIVSIVLSREECNREIPVHISYVSLQVCSIDLCWRGLSILSRNC